MYFFVVVVKLHLSMVVKFHLLAYLEPVKQSFQSLVDGVADDSIVLLVWFLVLFMYFFVVVIKLHQVSDLAWPLVELIGDVNSATAFKAKQSKAEAKHYQGQGRRPKAKQSKAEAKHYQGQDHSPKAKQSKAEAKHYQGQGHSPKAKQSKAEAKHYQGQGHSPKAKQSKAEAKHYQGQGHSPKATAKTMWRVVHVW